MSLIKDVFKEVKRRVIELKTYRHIRQENYSAPSTIFGAAILYTTLTNHFIIYGKIWLFIAVLYILSLWLLLKTPKKKDPFK